MTHGAGLVARVRAAARRAPTSPAIVAEGEIALRYGALDARAAELARTLREHGVGRECVVGLALPRSPEWVVSMIATWIAGGAFLPLDPSLPAARRARIVAEAGVRHVLGSRRHGVPETLDETIVVLDVETRARLGADGGAGSATDPDARSDSASGDDSPTHPDDLAYVIYTSGSTGAPKGVAVTHRGLPTLLDAQIAAFGLTPTSRALWVLSPAFDASVSDICTALGAGAALHIERADLLGDPDAFLACIEARGISHVDLPPSFLARLDPRRAPACLASIVIGGEPTPSETIRTWAPRVRLIGAYGPTEATVCTSLLARQADDTRALLGEPIAGVRYVIARPGSTESGSTDIAGVEEPGELLIGGPSVARGYVANAALSGERFIERDGTRFFRSGDRVVRHADGALELLGRVDRQLKIRGALVAPEEVELALARHPRVRRVAVEKRARGGRDMLVAWVELRGPLAREDAKNVDEASLAAFVGDALPPFAVPRRFAFVDSLPETESGKIDLAALAARPLPLHAPRGGAPATDAERALTALVCAVLDVPTVGREDDFFALGGDSLAVVELVGRAALAGLWLTPSLVYTTPILSALAAEMKTPRDEGVSVEVLRARALEASRTLESEALRDRRAARARRPASEPRVVFFTGATGFLGGRLLEELAARTDARFICLIRADDARDAARRFFARELRIASSRLLFVAGDLGRPFFGVGERAFRDYAGRADTVVHAAGTVSVAHDYEALAASNVLATREVLRFSALGRRKRLHFASTLSVFVSTDRARNVHREDDDLARTGVVHGGYAQSKWVAEALVRAVGSVEHVPFATSIYRYGLLTGDSRTGVGLENDWLSLFVRGLAAVGAVPNELDPELAMDVTPVDHAARATGELLLHGAPDAGVATYHVVGERAARARELVAAVVRAGVAVEAVTADAFLERVARRLVGPGRAQEAAACLALTRSLGDRAGFVGIRAMDLFQATGAELDHARADAVLAPAGIAAPRLDGALLDRYVAQILHGARAKGGRS